MTPWLLLLSVATFVGGIGLGLDLGRDLQRGEQLAHTVNQVNAALQSQERLVKEANAASRRMRAATAHRVQQDAQTTKEFKDALAATADSRSGCVFPDDVMRQLTAARNRAAAAAAGGLRAAVPAARADSAARP